MRIIYGLYCEDQHIEAQHGKQESFATDPQDDGEGQSPDLLSSVHIDFSFSICKN